MKNLTIEKIAEITSAQIVGDYSHIALKEAAGVVIDSRLVMEDYIFIANKGERVDGHDFLPSVMNEKKALFAICEHQVENISGPYLIVEDSLEALKKIATYYRSSIDTKIIGIVGSVGKTSTRKFVASVLAEKYNVMSTEGNYNNEIGVPLTLLKIREEHEIAVVEMGINHFGEMSRLTAMAHPDMCVMTNIGECHLENLIDRDGVLRAKSEVFEGMNEEGQVFVNGDDDKLVTIASVNGKTVIRYGLNAECINSDSNNNLKNDYYAANIVSHDLTGSDVTIKGANDSCIEALVPLPGNHMVYNAVAATAVGRYLGLSEQEIINGLKNCSAVEGRSNVLKLNKITLVDDCYNANPTSVRAAIDTLSKVQTEKVAILGDMFELGNKEKEMHGGIGQYAVEKGIDLLVCIGDLSKNMYEQAIAHGGKTLELLSSCAAEDSYLEASEKCTKVIWFVDIDMAIASLENLIKPDNTVLVKASHGMKFANIVKFIKEKF